MSFVAAALIVGGASVASSALSKGGSKKVSYSEPEASKKARALSLELGTESMKYPHRKIADLSEMELDVERETQKLMKAGPSPERDQVLQDLLKTATTPIGESPELLAIFKGITEEGQEEAGRIGRSLQLRGSIGSTGGRDIMGRNIDRTQERLVAAAAPFLALKQQAGRDVSNIVAQKETQQVGRLGAAAAVGKLRRGIEQTKLDADYQKLTNDINFRFGTQANILAGVQVNPTPVVSGGGPSTGQQVAGGLEMMLPLLMQGGGPKLLPGNQTAITAAGGLGNVANQASAFLAGP